MASSLVRRGIRLASPLASFVRHRHGRGLLSRLPVVASRMLGPQVRAAPGCPCFGPVACFASSAVEKSADAKLKRVLDSEIECAEEDVGSNAEEPTIPKNFPFRIIDQPGDQIITLKREFGNETIEVSVFLENNEDEAEEDDQDDDQEANEEAATLSNISLVVTVDKGKGSYLEFCCTLHPNEINIDSLTMKSHDTADDQSPYEGPEFSDLDESLQKAFCNFLEQRGITPSMTSFLQDYMMKKEDREYIAWLKNMKEFIEK